MSAQLATSPTIVDIKHFHFFCGSGFVSTLGVGTLTLTGSGTPSAGASSEFMSVAGPATNLLLALLAALAIRLGIAAGIFNPPDSIDFAHVIESTQTGVLTTVALFALAMPISYILIAWLDPRVRATL